MTQEEIEIYWKKCNNCGFLQHYSHLRCLKCKYDEFSKIQASGTGKLLTYTILKAPPMEFRDKGHYAIGIIEFENQIRAMGQIKDPNNLEIGMEMKPIFTKICDSLDGKEVQTYIFEPVR